MIKSVAKTSVFAALAMLATHSVARAELLLYEGFDYPAGDLTAAPHWAPLGSALPGTVRVVDGGSLSYPGFPKSVGNRSFMDQARDERAAIPILPSVTSGSVYYSLLLKLTEQPTATTYAIHLNGSRYSGRISFDKTGDETYRVGISNGTKAKYADSNLKVGETVLLVFRYTFTNDSASDDLALFINPDPKEGEPKEPSIEVSDRPETAIDSFILRQSDGAGSFEVDEVRVGTTWDAAMGREEISPRVAKARAEALQWSRHQFEYRLKWNSPGMITEVGVGLWAVPAPLDWDGDGDVDLLVSSGGKPENGLYLFERDGDEALIPRGRIANQERQLRVSQTASGPVLLSPGKVYRDFSKGAFSAPEKIDYKPDFYAGRMNHWNLVDWEGDGDSDLLIGTSDWREYGWDDAYNEKGEWTNGPLRGNVYLVVNEGTDEKPSYAKSRQVEAGGAPIDVYGAPSPVYTDWDGDGDLDIICGEFLNRITYFENVGTRSAPEFAEGRFMEVDGETLRMHLQMLQVSSADWDLDGDPDLIVGEEDGRVAFVENLGGGEIAAPVYLKQRAEEVKVGVLNTVFNYDWDGDGDEDIVTGNTAGEIVFVENTGGGAQPSWAPEVKLEADGEVIRFLAGENLSIQGPAEAIWGYTNIFVADWNNDALPDIMVNSIIGKIVWFENVGTRSEPKLAKAQPIGIAGDGPVPFPAWNWWKPEGRELVTQWRTTPNVVDVDEDGKMDLVLQDHEGYLAFYKRVGDPTKSSTVELGERIFRMANNAPASYNHVGEIHETDVNKDGVNDLLQRTASGGTIYYTRDPITRDYRVRSVDGMLDENTQLETHPADAGVLRMASGWAGQSGRRKFRLVDWDGDGDLDLLVNGRGINLLENVGSKGEFEFVDHGRISPHILAGHSITPSVVDWNRDGVPDLVVGPEDGHFYYYPRHSFGEMTPTESHK